MYRILLADDEELSRMVLERLLKREEETKLAGIAEDGDELLKMIEKEKPDIVITDICMPGHSGLETIASTLERGMATRFIITSAYANFEYARKAIQLGVEDFLPKPVRGEELHKAIENVKKKLGQKVPQAISYSRIIKAAKTYIDEHYGKHLTLEEVAAQIYLSPSYFSSLFKKETGFLFSDYLTKIRMEEAKKLMDQLEDNTAQVAEKVGYKDVKHFREMFRKTYGMTPAEYRRK